MSSLDRYFMQINCEKSLRADAQRQADMRFAAARNPEHPDYDETLTRPRRTHTCEG